MKILALVIYFLASANHSIALTKNHLERLRIKKDITYVDLIHENPGCPENSECSKPNGIKLLEWVKTLKTYSNNPKILSLQLERYRKKNGLPIMFLAEDTKELKLSIDPIIWDSRCRHHNQKDKVKIIKAMKFFRNNPKTEKIKFTQVKVGKKIFEIPYGDQPLMIWKKGLILIKDYEDYLYHLSIKESGNWKILYVPSRLIKKGRVSKNNIKCKEKAKPNKYFLGSYCSKIWNEDKKDYEIVEIQWSCP